MFKIDAIDHMKQLQQELAIAVGSTNGVVTQTQKIITDTQLGKINPESGLATVSQLRAQHSE